jgi:hypothetical protein
MMEDTEALKKRLDELISDHRDLDDTIARKSEDASVDQIELQRLKKRKLSLKDEIARIEAMIVPDIIA